MKLKIGQRVRVKTQEQLVDTYGIDEWDDVIDMPFGYVAEDMNPLQGKVVTIKSFENEDGVILQEAYWTWHIDMFVPVRQPISLRAIL